MYEVWAKTQSPALWKTEDFRLIADFVARPDLHLDRSTRNVILSAAASPMQTRTNAWRRPKDLESALGLSRPKRGCTGGSWCGWRSVVLRRVQGLWAPPDRVAAPGHVPRGHPRVNIWGGGGP